MVGYLLFGAWIAISLIIFHFGMGKYYTPYFKKRYKVSMKRYDGQNEDVKCWYNKDLEVYMYKEYASTYTLYPRGESNGYFNKSWLPMDKTMKEYFNSVTEKI